MSTRAVVFSIAFSAAVAVGFACGSSSSRDQFGDDQGSSGTSGTSGASGFGGDGSSGSSGSSGDNGSDPTTCAQAAASKTYVGCDYWPTVTANNVWSIFDYAVVVSNVGTASADVTVTGPNATNQKVSVAPGTLQKIYLPWVADLKGTDATPEGQSQPMGASVFSKGGAYHLVSSVPVVVYQFNALEYKASGGPPGKNWSSCPNDPLLVPTCDSYSNDASLLIPSTAWTQSYRVTGVPGWTAQNPLSGPQDVMGGYVVVTASQDGTAVTINLSQKGTVLAGGGIPATNGGGKITQTLNAGDVIEVVTPKGQNYDLSGSLVTSTKPVEVFTGIPCINVPADNQACDHVEESVVPAEALGKQYVVTAPTAPAGGIGKHLVRFYGNRDGTTLTYAPSKPAGCPDTLGAGQVAECTGLVSTDFVVAGSNEFGISSFTPGATIYDPSGMDSRGDPDQSSFGSTEQFRLKFVFLSPDDYDVNYAVVAGPEGANPTIDGKALTGYKALGMGFGVWRVAVSGGAHTLTSSAGVGVQVMGYGANTSYQYPGGLNLHAIAPPPPGVN